MRNKIGKIAIISNGGYITTNRKEIIIGFSKTWFNPNSNTGILSLNKFNIKYQVTYDNCHDNAFFSPNCKFGYEVNHKQQRCSLLPFVLIVNLHF